MHPRARRTYASLSLALTLALTGCSDDDPSDPTSEGGTVRIQISGEDAAVDGFPFPEGGEVTLADGWSIRFDHVLVVIGDVTLSEDPDLDPSDASRTGAVVARAAGPWVVDLHAEGSEPGAGGEGRAIALGTLEGETERDDAPFADDRRYAVGFRTRAAAAGATRVNLDGDAEALFETMIDRGYAVLYAGTASFAGTDCRTTDDGYDFTAWPTEIPFQLGFATPTSAVNCQNQDNQGDPFPDEEYQRGLAIPQSGEAVLQITVHLEHPFYTAVVHEPALAFDPFAAQALGRDDGFVLGVEDLAGVDPTALTDATGEPLPARVCDDSSLPSAQQAALDTGTLPVDPGASPGEALRDLRDFVHYVQSTQLHLNGGEGLCFVQRDYPSP